MPRMPRMPAVGRPVILVGVAVVGLALVFGVLALVKRGGEAAAEYAETAVEQIDRAGDLQARTALKVAYTAAQTASMESGSYLAAGPDELASMEPSLRYVTGPSTGPTVVSVAATEADWAAAVLASSGTCFTTTVSRGDATLRGGACTGSAAMSSP